MIQLLRIGFHKIDGYKHFVTTKQFVSDFHFQGDYIVEDYESIEEHLSNIEQKKVSTE